MGKAHSSFYTIPMDKRRLYTLETVLSESRQAISPPSGSSGWLVPKSTPSKF